MALRRDLAGGVRTDHREETEHKQNKNENHWMTVTRERLELNRPHQQAEPGQRQLEQTGMWLCLKARTRRSETGETKNLS